MDQNKATENNNYIQKPGEIIKPNIPDGVVPELVKRLYGLDVISCKELDSYDDRNYHVIVSDQTKNPNILTVCKEGYVVKILNKKDSRRPLIIDAQFSLLNHLKGKTVTIPEVIFLLNETKMSLEKFHVPSSDGNDNAVFEHYIVYLLKYIPGKVLADCPYGPSTLYSLGQMVGNLQNALKGFSHPFYDEKTSIWNIIELTKLSAFMSAVQEPKKRNVVIQVIEAFQKEVVPKFHLMQKGVIHCDLNADNILVEEVLGQKLLPPDEKVYAICGLLDFSDVIKSYCIIDIALCIAHLTMDCKHVKQLEVGGHILAGVLNVFQLNSEEMETLKILICGRLCQLLVLGALSFQQDPTNMYILRITKNAWPLLNIYWETPNDILMEQWQRIIDSYKLKEAEGCDKFQS